MIPGRHVRCMRERRAAGFEPRRNLGAGTIMRGSRRTRIARVARWHGLRLRAAWRRRLPAGVRRLGGAAGLTSLATFPLLLAVSLAAASGALERLIGARTAGEALHGPMAEAWTSEAEKALRPLREARREAASAYAERYRVSTDVAVLILDAARAEELDEDLAFRLVRVESSFRPRAVGPTGSIGLTQVQPATARWLDSTLTRERLFEPETNLRVGFRYLRMLLDRYDDDTRLALLAYNRGPGTVAGLLAVGEDPGNGYASRVLGSGAGPRLAAADD